MTPKVISLSSKNQVSLPVGMLKQLQVTKGAKFMISFSNGTLVIEPIKDPIKSLKGILKGRGSVQEFLDERKKEEANSYDKYIRNTKLSAKPTKE